MAREITTSIDIAAPASAVWAILTDFHGYSDWNPFVRLIKGDLQEGAKLEVLLDTPNRNPMKFAPTLVKLTPERELRWLGKLWGLPGLFTGEHRFEIEPSGETAVRFVQAERFTGILVPFVWSRLADDTRAGFVTMNEALKRLAEQG
jgi:hypothetical protein